MSGLYVGNPLVVGMVQLPNPPRGYTNPTDRHINVQTLISGGTATARAVNSRQAFQYQWDWKNQLDADIIRGFYTGAWGTGPYVVLDPAARNYLPFDVSLMGGRRGVLTGWATGTGTLAYDSTIVTNDPPGGCLRWVGAGSGTGMCAGIMSGAFTEADPATALPYVATEPYSVSIWGKTASGTASCKAGVGGRSYPVGTRTNTAGANVTLNSTTWQQMTASVTAGFSSTSRFVILTVTCNTASAPDILLTNPELSMTAAPLSGWVAGTGAPRCSVTDVLDSSVQVVQLGRSLQLSLREI